MKLKCVQSSEIGWAYYTYDVSKFVSHFAGENQQNMLLVENLSNIAIMIKNYHLIAVISG